MCTDNIFTSLPISYFDIETISYFQSSNFKSQNILIYIPLGNIKMKTHELS